MKKVYETTMRKLVVMMLIAVMAFTFVGCSSTTDDTTVETTEDVTEETTEDVTEDVVDEETEEAEDAADDLVVETIAIGEGETVFAFTVVFEDGTETVYEVSTDASTVGEALIEVGLIEGDDSEYGLYVKTVDGVTLDWDADAAYWGFFIDGEMAMTGVDSTEIVEGSVYTFAYAQ